MRLSRYFGPSTLIAAAFIGPGTVTTCTMAGVHSGYSLLWALVFSIVATLVLQEMSARVGWVTRKGLGEAISNQFSSGIPRLIVFGLVIGAILIGNAAYEAGNLSGGVLGLELILGGSEAWPLVVGAISFALLFFGNYKSIEKLLIGLVIIMSLCFLCTAILVKPNLGEVLQGFIPREIRPNLLLILGLIGTTVVPYNLFLHASTISKKWTTDSELKDIRRENSVAIILGGIISMLIIITAAATATTQSVSSAGDLARQLEPVFGSYAKQLMGIGLLAAGCSSALTAPLAAAYAAQGLFGWSREEKNWKFRLVWMIILLIGIAVATTGLKPILIIKFAQITNAILLPLVASYLILISNSKQLLGQYSNKLFQNILGIVILVITFSLSIRSLNNVFNFF